MTAVEQENAKTRTKYAAPGQYLGYALQPVRLCFHLLTCPPKAKVSLEYLDDVAVHYEGGVVLFEQAKSALTQNPLSDWAVDFWKSISNWLGSLSSGNVSADTSQFRLYVTPIKMGKVSSSLSDALTSVSIEKITEKIRQGVAKQAKPPACLPYLRPFLDASPLERLGLISRFTVCSADTDPLDPIRSLLAPTVAPALVDALCQFAIGRAKEGADRLIRSGKPAILDGDDFKAAFRNFVQKNNLPGLLAPLSMPPPDGAVSTLLASLPTFVKQLDLIQANEDERVRAVSDFLRSSADKTSWAEAGLVCQRGLDDWDAELVRRHKLVCGEVSDIHSDKDAAIRGRIVYRRSAQMEPPLDGQAVPGHFVHGCLNALADVKTIGWHPEYEALLKKEDEK